MNLKIIRPITETQERSYLRNKEKCEKFYKSKNKAIVTFTQKWGVER